MLRIHITARKTASAKEASDNPIITRETIRSSARLRIARIAAKAGNAPNKIIGAQNGISMPRYETCFGEARAPRAMANPPKDDLSSPSRSAGDWLATEK